MKIEHIPDPYAIFADWCFQTKVDELLRYHTQLDFFAYTFEITDCWTGKSYQKQTFKKEEETYLAVEQLAVKANPYLNLKAQIIQFNRKPLPDFDSNLLDKTFDAWLYNSGIYQKVSTIEGLSENFVKQQLEIETIFNEQQLYYYDRTANEVVLLDRCEVRLHRHFMIQPYIEAFDIEHLLIKHFGKNLFNTTEFNNLNHWSYAFLLTKSAHPNQLLSFQRAIALNWLTYMNNHFIIPIYEIIHRGYNSAFF